ncbi:MAG: aminotransferase class I/II-fold pyridoxal phosphate-dependent enzyme [Geminicoccaceae bacterium]|nr:aminotransferase class I/II-fold pyridoxal phosphate-dependent enzyme [Geminicoccaceae bacterium]
MDIFSKYGATRARHDAVVSAGTDPFGQEIDEIVSATEAIIAGRRTIMVGTNNYLGLSFDPACRKAAADAALELGTGTTGSRIANGTYARHRELEEGFKRFFDRKHAIVFTTGYQANLATLSALAGPKDYILSDSDNHASIWDGCRLSQAETVMFRHNDPDHLDKRLSRLEGKGECKLIVVEGLYSMLGDTAPIREFVEVKERHGAWLWVDEAHSVGVYGENGRGVAEAQGVEEGVDFIAGTFSKSLAGTGGFAVSNHPDFELLRLTARPYMFAASPTPSSMASVAEALRQIESRPELRRQIWRNAEQLYAGLRDAGFELCSALSPVIAVRMPDERSVVHAWNRLIREGVYVNLAVPPGTPGGVCLLRCSVSAAHTPGQIDEVIRRFTRVRDEIAGPAVSIA